MSTGQWMGQILLSPEGRKASQGWKADIFAASYLGVGTTAVAFGSAGVSEGVPFEDFQCAVQGADFPQNCGLVSHAYCYVLGK